MPSANISGTTWRVTPHGVTRRVDGRWVPVTARMLRALPGDSEEAAWLAAHGVDRWQSGPTQPESERTTVQVLLRLSPADAALLDSGAEAQAVSRSAYVAALARAAEASRGDRCRGAWAGQPCRERAGDDGLCCQHREAMGDTRGT